MLLFKNYIWTFCFYSLDKIWCDQRNSWLTKNWPKPTLKFILLINSFSHKWCCCVFFLWFWKPVKCSRKFFSFSFISKACWKLFSCTTAITKETRFHPQKFLEEKGGNMITRFLKFSDVEDWIKVSDLLFLNPKFIV